MVCVQDEAAIPAAASAKEDHFGLNGTHQNINTLARQALQPNGPKPSDCQSQCVLWWTMPIAAVVLLPPPSLLGISVP
jgi:hypothetical protein